MQKNLGGISESYSEQAFWCWNLQQTRLYLFLTSNNYAANRVISLTTEKKIGDAINFVSSTQEGSLWQGHKNTRCQVDPAINFENKMCIDGLWERYKF